MQLPQKNTTSLEVQLKCPAICVITHGFPQKPSVFSLRSIYLSSYVFYIMKVSSGQPGSLSKPLRPLHVFNTLSLLFVSTQKWWISVQAKAAAISQPQAQPGYAEDC